MVGGLVKELYLLQFFVILGQNLQGQINSNVKSFPKFYRKVNTLGFLGIEFVFWNLGPFGRLRQLQDREG